MCGRYRLRRHWEQDLDGYLRLVINRIDIDELQAGSDEARPTDRLPIIRRNEDGELVPELRRGAFIHLIDGRTTIDVATRMPKKLVNPVINAMSEKVRSSFMWNWAYKERRSLVPMPSWDEWPELLGGGKQRVRISKPDEPTFMAAGLYDENIDPQTGVPVGVYTVCTVPPTVLLGTVHDRAPMVFRPPGYGAGRRGIAQVYYSGMYPTS